MKKEIRTLQQPAEVEVRDDGNVGKIYGYAAVFNKDSEDIGFIEQIAPGAFKKALKISDIRGLKNHDPNLIFARQGVNLSLKEDKDGLYYEATPINTRNFSETAEEVRAGLLTGQSFGFTVLKDEWEDLDTDTPKRTIREVAEVMDVGPVVYPAYQDTSVALRSLEAAKRETVFPENHAKSVLRDERLKLVSEETSIEIKTGELVRIFSGDDKINQAIECLRSLQGGDSAEPVEPKGQDGKDEAKDETLARIDELIKKYKRD